MSKENTESGSGPAIAMVAVSSERLPNIAELRKACAMSAARRGGFLSAIFGRKKPAAEECEWKDGILVFEEGETLFTVSLMPAPIPWSNLEGPCATAWWWPEATDRMKSHKFHFIVAIIGGPLEPVERRLTLTRSEQRSCPLKAAVEPFQSMQVSHEKITILYFDYDGRVVLAFRPGTEIAGCIQSR